MKIETKYKIFQVKRKKIVSPPNIMIENYKEIRFTLFDSYEEAFKSIESGLYFYTDNPLVDNKIYEAELVILPVIVVKEC